MAMELKDLSSNWRKLQQKLKEESASQQVKRKAEVANSLASPDRNTKKVRLSGSHSKPHIVTLDASRKGNRRSKKMGLTSSKAKPSTVQSGTNGTTDGTHRSSSLSSSKPPPTTKSPHSSGTSLPSATLALWAHDNNISRSSLNAAYGSHRSSSSLPGFDTFPKDQTDSGLIAGVDAGKYIALDCEMVGVGPSAVESALARVSIVNWHGEQVYDSFVQAKEEVTDYRTEVSGITRQLLRGARTLEEVQRDVVGLLDGRVLVGHAVRNDLAALMLGHPRRDVRDTSRYPGYRELAGGRTPALKRLAREVLKVEIQGGEHSSIEDARATMLLFRKEKEGFDSEWLREWGDEREGSRPGGKRSRSGRVKGRKRKK